MHKIKALFLDFDGVIVPIEYVISALRGVLIKHGIYVSSTTIREKIIGWPLRQSLPRVLDLDPKTVESIRSEFHIAYAKKAVKGRLNPGIRQLFNLCKSAGIKTAIITTKAYAELKPVLEKHHLYPDILITQDDVKHVKPHPEPILKGCDKLGIDPENVVMVGDHVFDILSAREAGCRAWAVLSGARSKEELKAAGAEYIFENSLALYHFLEERFKRLKT